MKNLELTATPTVEPVSASVMTALPTAEPLKNPETRAQTGKYLTFTLNHESYGIRVLKIREIIRVQEITVVPQMPEYVKGVINLRGKIIPILDMRIKFGLPADMSDSTCIIVVQLAGIQGVSNQMGLIVDGVEEVINIASGDIEDAPHFGSSLSTKYIVGMAKVKGVVKILVDIDRVIGADAAELIKNIEAAA